MAKPKFNQNFFKEMGKIGRRRANLSKEQLQEAGRKGAANRWKNHKKEA
jgi:hypothetical protein